VGPVVGVLLRPGSLLGGLAPACWGGLAVQQGVVAGQDRGGPVEARQRADGDHLGGWLVVGDAAGLHQHHRRLGHAGVDRLAHRPDERWSGQVTMGQQHLDQRPGAGGVAVLAAGSGPERLVGLGVNTPCWRAWASAVAPGSAPGFRTSTSR
jgi:hypothetical protein